MVSGLLVDDYTTRHRGSAFDLLPGTSRIHEGDLSDGSAVPIIARHAIEGAFETAIRRIAA